METAGRASAHLIERLYPRGEVVGLVGSGNNGGDALVALRALAAWGRPVRAVLGGRDRHDDPLLHGWPVPFARAADLGDDALGALLAGRGGEPVLMDGLLGTGLAGPPREAQARLIEATHAAAGPVIALDVPSGVDADGGGVPGEAVRADLTVAFGWPKLGTLLHPGRMHAGRIVAVEIGFPPVDEATWAAWLMTPAWAAAQRPAREPDTHKNRVGSVLVVAGRSGMAGAAILASRAALRIGAGYGRLASHPANREVVQEAVPDAPFVDARDADALTGAAMASRAIAIGPGLGTDEAAARALELVLALDAGGAGDSGGPALVVDADALNLIAASPSHREALRQATHSAARQVDRQAARHAAGGPVVGVRRRVVLTPHPGEMARLLGCEVDEVQADRPRAARALAADTGAVVVLKGSPTLVAERGGRLGVSAVGGSELAVAGMGDVLTGAVAGLLAQGLDAGSACGLALVATARAAERSGLGPGLAASDVPDQIPHALAELGPGHSELSAPWVVLDMDSAR